MIMAYFDTAHDYLFNCTIVYTTPRGWRKHFRAKTIAPAADLALEIAERLLHADRRRQVHAVEYTQAIQQ
jgi:hypothetical protein